MLAKIVKAKSNPDELFLAFPETNNPLRIYLINENGIQTYCSIDYYLEQFEQVDRKRFVVQMVE